MEVPNLFVKVLTISFFACLLIGFVAYKSGLFDKTEAEVTIDNYASNIADLDTLPPIPFDELDSVEQQKRMLLMLSSKSGQIVYPEDVSANDTLPDSLRRKDDPSIIPSSKSGMPFSPQEEKKKKKRKKKKRIMSGSKSLSTGVIEVEDIEKDSFILIPSSKSAAIFEPQQQNQAPQ